MRRALPLCPLSKMMASMTLLISLLSLPTMVARATDGSADMTFHGTLIEPPPCTINDDNRIEVDFGERIGINKVNGVNYRMPLNYLITCEYTSSDGAGMWVMSMSLAGSSADFDSDALATDKDDLAIRIYHGDEVFTPNTSVVIDLVNQPILEAVPVKNTTSKLTEGAFEAWATLKVDYQ